MPKTNQPDLFAADDEPDLFGAPTPQAFKPDVAHVRNRLQALVTQMAASETWPWDEAMVALHRERTFAYLCGLLAPEEAEDWHRKIETEIARLNAAAPALAEAG